MYLPEYLLSRIEEEIRILLEANEIDISGKKIIDIGGGNGNFTVPLARAAYKMGAAEVHVVDPALDIDDTTLNNERLTTHKVGIENMPNKLKGTFDFATIFLYLNLDSHPGDYPRGVAEILKPEGQLLIGGDYVSNSPTEFDPFFGKSVVAKGRKDEGMIGKLNPWMYMLSSPVHRQGLADIATELRKPQRDVGA